MSVNLRKLGCLLLLLPLMTVTGAVQLGAAEKAVTDKKTKTAKSQEPPLPKTLMTTRGQVLFADPFQSDTFKSLWDSHGGDWSVVDNTLRSGDSAGGGHHPQIVHRLKMKDVVVQCRFRLDGANWMGFSFGDKEHILRVMINKEQFEVVKMSGTGATTKGERLDRQAMKWEPGRWYTMLIEWHGAEVVAQVDDQFVLYGSSETVNVEKSSILLINGGSHAWFDDLTIWEAVPDAKWEKRRPLLLQQKEKRK